MRIFPFCSTCSVNEFSDGHLFKGNSVWRWQGPGVKCIWAPHPVMSGEAPSPRRAISLYRFMEEFLGKSPGRQNRRGRWHKMSKALSLQLLCVEQDPSGRKDPKSSRVSTWMGTSTTGMIVTANAVVILCQAPHCFMDFFFFFFLVLTTILWGTINSPMWG